MYYLWQLIILRNDISIYLSFYHRLALSVKMNVLLFAPPLALILTKRFGLLRNIHRALLVIAIQVLLNHFFFNINFFWLMHLLFGLSGGNCDSLSTRECVELFHRQFQFWQTVFLYLECKLENAVRGYIFEQTACSHIVGPAHFSVTSVPTY